MQYKPGNWVTGFKRSPRAANVQHRDMGLFLNSSGKFEPIDDSWDNLHSGGLFISDDNKLYFRDETNKDIYINSPAAETLGLSAGNATTAGFVTINEEGFDTDFRVEASGVANALFVQGSDGAVGIGTDAPAEKLHIYGTSNVDLRMQIVADADVNRLQFYRAKAGPAVVTDNQDIVAIQGYGYDGSAYQEAASILMEVDGTAASGDMPGRIAFYTTADGGTTSSEAMRIDSAGQVGIGVAPRDDWNSNYTALQIGAQGSLANYSDGRTSVGDNWYDNSAGEYRYIAADFASRHTQHNGAHLFDVAVSGSADGTITWLRAMDIEQGRDVKVVAGNLVIGTAEKGIDFSNQTSPGAGMTSELLDRYEEGTWTPTLLGTTTNPTVSYATQGGDYTRIGNLLHCTFIVGTSANTGGAGSILIGGLPFTQSASTNKRTESAIAGYNLNVTSGTYQLAVEGRASVDTLLIRMSVDDAAWANPAWSLATDASVYFSGSITILL